MIIDLNLFIICTLGFISAHSSSLLLESLSMSNMGFFFGIGTLFFAMFADLLWWATGAAVYYSFFA